MATDYQAPAYPPSDTGTSESPPRSRPRSTPGWLIPVLAGLALLLAVGGILLWIFRDNDTDKVHTVYRPHTVYRKQIVQVPHYITRRIHVPICNPKAEPVINRTPYYLSVRPGAYGATPSRQQLAQTFASLAHANQGKNQAAVVLTFGHPTSYAGGLGPAITQANILAHQMNTQLRGLFPRLFKTAVLRDYHDLSRVDGGVSFEVYLYNPNCRSPQASSARG